MLFRSPPLRDGCNPHIVLLYINRNSHRISLHYTCSMRIAHTEWTEKCRSEIIYSIELILRVNEARETDFDDT